SRARTLRPHRSPVGGPCCAHRTSLGERSHPGSSSAGSVTLRAVTRLGSSLRALGIRIGWLLLAVVVAVGIAGIVAAGNRLPGTEGRPELTWAADRAATTQLEASTTALATLARDLAKLGEMGRLALTAVTDRD